MRKEKNQMSMLVLWGLVFAVSLIVEAATTALLSIWFMCGSIIAFIACLMGAPAVVQYVCFVGVSILLFLILRPMIRKTGHGPGSLQDNVERYIGKRAQVTEMIDNIQGTGRVVYNGVSWAARSEDDAIAIHDGFVIITEVNGAKLTVRLPSEAAE